MKAIVAFKTTNFFFGDIAMGYDYEKEIPVRQIYSLTELEDLVTSNLGSYSTVQDRDDALEILKEKGYIFQPIMENGEVRHDNIHEFWPENMLDLILEKQNARIENDYSDFNIYNIQNSFVYKENRAKKINVFAFEVIAQNQSALIEAALKLNSGDFIGYELDSKYIKIPRDLEYVLRNFEIYDDDGDIVGYSSKADDYLYENYAVEL